MNKIIEMILKMCEVEQVKITDVIAELQNFHPPKIIGYCERCGEPIIENEKFFSQDGVIFCPDCQD